MKGGESANVLGIAVFLFGVAIACLAGCLAHYMTNEAIELGWTFDALMDLTIIGIIIASMGIALLVYEVVFENHRQDTRNVLKSATLISAVISTFFLATTFWAGLVTIHMDRLLHDHRAMYEAFEFWTIPGFYLGSTSLAVSVYGLASSTRIQGMRPSKDRPLRDGLAKGLIARKKP